MKRFLTIEIEEEARLEIDKAWDWYEEQKVGLGEVFLKQLSNAFKAISRSPEGFIAVDQYRQIPLEKFPYVVIYKLFEKKIVVYAVFHTKRHPGKKIP
jgi:plasmid stabilization system protein ParE